VGPGDRPYVAVQISSGNEIDLSIKSFDEVIADSMTSQAGLAVMDKGNSGQPSAVLRYGAIWAYHEYKNLGGCANNVYDFEKAMSINEDEPFEALVSNSDKVLIGSPSLEIFPSYIREMIKRELSSVLPNTSLEFHLLEQECYAMSLSILLNTGIDLSQNEKNELSNSLLWYMPPYLPISIG